MVTSWPPHSSSGRTNIVTWRRGLVGTLDADSERAVLRLPDRTISFPASCGPALRTLQSGLVADAGSLPGLDAADGAVLIRRLLREATLVPVVPVVPDVAVGTADSR